MKRQWLLEKLAQYTTSNKEEEELLEELIQFVEEYEDCFERSLGIGHITGSAWIVDVDKEHVLLTHHRKIGRWLQLGGHSDGNPNTLEVALEEAEEESGLEDFQLLFPEIFDIDIHTISAREEIPEHKHYDVRFIFQADKNKSLKRSERESKDLQWIKLEEVKKLNTGKSIARMVDKTLKLEV